MLPRWFFPAGIVVACLALIPFALVWKVRAVKSNETRPQIIFDMDQQPKFKTQSVNRLFADGRSMRPAVEGTVARGELRDDDHLYRGRVDGEWADTFPMVITPEMMARGRDRFEIYCMPCHGLSGHGDGPVARRAESLAEGTWTPPTDYHTDPVRQQPVGQLFNTITNGVRSMPAYGGQVPVKDRWAIVAYLRALQKSQWTKADELPAADRGKLAE